MAQITGKIIGLGSYFPPQTLTNDDLSRMVETNDEWIIERTGIKSRHIADGIEDKTSTMAIKAAKAAVEDAGIDPKDIDLIVAASTTPDVVFPSVAVCVQEALGCSEDVGCFDVNSACPGWLAAFNTVQGFIESGNSKLALVIGAETLSNYIDWTDRGTCILFGDGAGAAVLRAEEGKKNEIIMRSSGKRGVCLHCENRKQPKRYEEEDFEQSTFFYMAGRDVFRFAITEVPKLIKDLSNKYDFSLDDVDYFILHQANARIIESTAKKLNIGIEKFPMTLEQTGNTSSASIPALLDQMKRDGRLKKGMKLVLASFGGGLTWDANYIEY